MPSVRNDFFSYYQPPLIISQARKKKNSQGTFLWKPEFGNAHNCMSCRDTSLPAAGPWHQGKSHSLRLWLQQRPCPCFSLAACLAGAALPGPAVGTCFLRVSAECQDRLICQELWNQGSVSGHADCRGHGDRLSRGSN